MAYLKALRRDGRPRSTSTPPARPPRPWSTASCSPAAGRRSSTSGRPSGSASTATARAATGTSRRSTTARPRRPCSCSSAPTRRSTSSTPAIHEAALYGLDALLKAQFPNGAFPQVWTQPGRGEAGREGEVPGLRLEDRGAGQELLGLLHAQRQPRGDRRRHAHRRAPGLQGRQVQGGAGEARRLPDPGADARPAAGLVPAVQLRDGPDLGAEVRAAGDHRLGVAGRDGDADQDRPATRARRSTSNRSRGAGVLQEVPAAGREGRPVLRVQDEQAAVHGRERTSSPTTTPPPRATTAGSSRPASTRIEKAYQDAKAGASPPEPDRRRSWRTASARSSRTSTRRGAGSRPTRASGSSASRSSQTGSATSPARSSAATSRR